MALPLGHAGRAPPVRKAGRAPWTPDPKTPDALRRPVPYLAQPAGGLLRRSLTQDRRHTQKMNRTVT